MRIIIIAICLCSTLNNQLVAQAQVRIAGNGTADTIATIKTPYTGVTNIVGLAVKTHPGPSLGIGGYFFGGQTGVKGEAENQSGVLGISQNGTGVFGHSTATSGPTNGVFGRSDSPLGHGVYGNTTATTGFANGVYGRTVSSEGAGVYGSAQSATGSNQGVLGNTISTGGVGVKGTATAATGPTNGVRGESESSSGIGVAGIANANTGNTRGVYGTISSPAGYGVFGSALNSTGPTAGVLGQSSSDEGKGVYGIGVHGSGVNYGVYGKSNSPNGYAGYFLGQMFVHNDGEYNRGVRIQMNSTAGGSLMDALYINGNGICDNNYGARITIGNTSGNVHGVYSNVNKYSGTGSSYGILTENISSSGDARYGVKTEVSGTVSSSPIYGVHSLVSGNSGSSPVYGMYSFVNSGVTTGQSYGLYAANFNGGFAGYFNGRTAIAAGSDASYSPGSGFLTIGNEIVTNVVMDDNEILARNNGNPSTLHLQATGGDLLLCKDELGGVGIGILTAGAIPDGYLLAVDGKGIFEELRVELSGAWPDYVFDDNYDRLEIHELKSFIADNGHLPNIPSATEIEDEGLHLGEMQRRMMEKIEELTLYVIELQGQIDELKNERDN